MATLSPPTSLAQLDLYRQSTASPAPALARNPVALRLYKVLGSTFDDDASREALLTLSELYTAPPPKAPSDEVENARVGALAFLDGPPPGETAAHARRNLRRDIETKLSDGAQKFLKAFGAVDQKLDTLQAHISDMRVRCDDAQKRLQETNLACRSLLDRAESLREERQDVDRRQSIVTVFLARFTLSEDEIESLVSGDVPIGRRFFNAMDKAHTIRADCRVLMSGEDSASQAGLDIMAATAQYLEKAYDKLFRWCSLEFRNLGRDSVLEVSSNLREGIKRLRQRPELLGECLMTLAQTRRAALLAAFLSALTNPSSGTRPIELHAHDALRYVGDMLAWVHQSIAAEHEFLESLFGTPVRQRMIGAVREREEDGWIAELMDGAVSGLCGPLKGRVVQAVRALDNAVVAYKVASLLGFYSLTMMRTVGVDALLSKTLKETTDAAYKVFFDAIEAQGRSLLRIELDPSDPSLTPPPSLLTHFATLRSVLSLHASDSDSEDDKSATREEMVRILDTMVDPALHMLYGAAEEKEEKERRRGRSWDGKVFVLNGLTYIMSVLEPYAFTKAKQQMVEKLIDERVTELIEEHYENLLQDTGLKDAIHTLETKSPTDILSRLPPTSPQTLTLSLSQFSTWLADLEAVHSSRLSHLSAPALHARAHRAALLRLGKAYERLCKEVRSPGNRYEAAATLLGSERPFGSVGALWQILGIEEHEET
ncbi:oligomeric complex COG6 [Peniophora sp. CONT]|nr:oligomeric complex COG6 [Peniophora sp. CONT]